MFRRRRVSPLDVVNGARTIEVTAVQLGHKLGVAIYPLGWHPSLPPRNASLADNYSLKAQANLKGHEEFFEILFPREWVEKSSGAVEEVVERKTMAAIVKVREKLVD